MSREQKRLFERAAAIEGVTLTDFAISSMQRAATHVVRGHAAIELSESNRRAFIDALLIRRIRIKLSVKLRELI